MTTDLKHLPSLPDDRSPGIGCIGAGFIMADCHLVAYRAAGFNPIAISSRDRKKADAVAARHSIGRVYDDYRELLDDNAVEILDIAVPPDAQLEVVGEAVKRNGHIRGILAQKPLGIDYAQARRIVDLCRDVGITLAVNQNMRFDHSIRACKALLEGNNLGAPVLATIEMRAVPHWMPWQQDLGWLTLRMMSIHHLDTFRYLFGNPRRVFASVAVDPRTSKKFPHEDGICLYILEYDNGFRATAWDDVWAGPILEGAAKENYIRWRVEGTDGLARGTIGWPSYPAHTPSTIDYSLRKSNGQWHSPRWSDAWFPDAFVGPMGELLCALEENRTPVIGGDDNLMTMALVDACYLSVKEHRAVDVNEVIRTSSDSSLSGE
jgi:predicted dehydrogenase